MREEADHRPSYQPVNRISPGITGWEGRFTPALAPWNWMLMMPKKSGGKPPFPTCDLITYPGTSGIPVMELNLAFIGFGSVARAFARMLEERQSSLANEYGLRWKTTAIATGN